MDQQLPQLSNASDLDKLIHDFEYENQRYVKLIDKENQHIEALEKRIAEGKLNINKLQENNTQLDEDTKRAHKQFTCNRDNCKSLKRTLLVLKDHEEALIKKLEAINETANQEQCERDEILKHYMNIWEDYQDKYQRFPMVVELQKQKNKVNCLETQLHDKECQMITLKSQIQQWNESSLSVASWNILLMARRLCVLHCLQLLAQYNLDVKNFMERIITEKRDTLTSISIKLKTDTVDIVHKIKSIVEEKDKIVEEISLSEKKWESLADDAATTEMVPENEACNISDIELNNIMVTVQEPKTNAVHESEESAWISMFSGKDEGITSTNSLNKLKTNNFQTASSMQLSSKEYDLPVPPKQPQHSTSQMTPQLSVPHKTLPVSFSQHVAPQHCRNLLASQTLSPQVATSETRAKIGTSAPCLPSHIPRLQQNFRMPTSHPVQMNITRGKTDQGPVCTSVQSVPVLRPMTPRISQLNTVNQPNVIPSKSQSSPTIQKKLADIKLSKPNCQQNSQHVMCVQSNMSQFSQPTTPLLQTASSRIPANSVSLNKSVQNKGVTGEQKSPIQLSNISPVESPSSSQNPKTPEATDKSSPFSIDKHHQKIKLLSKSPGPHTYSSRLMFTQDDKTNGQDTPALVRSFSKEDSRFMIPFGNGNSSLTSLCENNSSSPDVEKFNEVFSFSRGKKSDNISANGATLIPLFGSGDNDTSDSGFSFGSSNADKGTGGGTLMSLFGSSGEDKSDENEMQETSFFSFGGRGDADEESRGFSLF